MNRLGLTPVLRSYLPAYYSFFVILTLPSSAYALDTSILNTTSAYTLFGATCFLILLVLIWVTALRRQVNLKTQHLEKEIQRRSESEKRLRRINKKFEAFTRSMPDAGFVISKEGMYEAVFTENNELLYMPVQKMLGKKVQETLPITFADKVMETINKTLVTGETQCIEYELKTGNQDRIFEGHVSKIDDKSVAWLARDITTRIQNEQQIRKMAYYDELTGLANRKTFFDRLKQAQALANRSNLSSALFVIDVDFFKQINDEYGHDAGDQALKQIAETITLHLRATDTASRLGGDEFSILLNLMNKPQDAANLAHSLLQAIKTCMTRQAEIQLSVSIGIALYQPGQDLLEWLKHADLALYRAKQQGRNQCQFFSSSMNDEFERGIKLADGIRLGMQKDQFYLVYQPQYSIKTGMLEGVETLLRWKDDAGNMISPAEFIPIAESHGLINDLGNWVLEQGMKQGCKWLLNDVCPPLIAINLSPKQMKEMNWSHGILKLIHKTGFPAERLELEITEGALVENIENTLIEMMKLRRQGVKFSIDDFGTGYSSMQYLEQLPIDKLKIDIHFIRTIIESKNNQAIVRAIISLAHNLNLTCIAEGVEDPNQLERLRIKGCDEVQGYLTGRPMQDYQLEPLLKEGAYAAAILQLK